MKYVYIAHPMSGDIVGNTQKVLELCERLKAQPGILPVAPYLTFFDYLDDNKPEERNAAMDFNGRIIFWAVDELWAFGTSKGVEAEVTLAKAGNVPVRRFTLDGAEELPAVGMAP